MNISVEGTFERSLVALGSIEQRECLSAIRWFEGLTEEDRRKKSRPIDCGSRRKLRFIRGPRDIRIVYALSANHGRHWLMVCVQANMTAMCRKVLGTPESLDVFDVSARLAVLTASEGEAEERERPTRDADAITSQAEIDRWIEAADDIALFANDARETCSRIRNRIGDRFKELERVKASLATQSKASTANDENLQKIIARLNQKSNECDSLKQELQRANKRIATLSTDLQVNKTSAEEVRRANQRILGLQSELAASRAALQRGVSTALTDVAKEVEREKCSKVLEDQAIRLSSTGRQRDEDQAEDLRTLARRIRELK